MRLDSCPNDYLIYGLEEADFYRLPLLNRCESVTELIETLPEGTLVVQAHPFRDNMVVQNPEALFGLETFNSHTETFRNETARAFALHYGKAMTSGSDIHDMTRLAKGGILTGRRICTPEDLTAVLRSREYSLIEE